MYELGDYVTMEINAHPSSTGNKFSVMGRIVEVGTQPGSHGHVRVKFALIRPIGGTVYVPLGQMEYINGWYDDETLEPAAPLEIAKVRMGGLL